jgi:hypothetical protein
VETVSDGPLLHAFLGRLRKVTLSHPVSPVSPRCYGKSLCERGAWDIEEYSKDANGGSGNKGGSHKQQSPRPPVRIHREGVKSCVETNLQNKGLISADRGTKATLMRTIPSSLFKSYTKDLLFPIFELVFQHRLNFL